MDRTNDTERAQSPASTTKISERLHAQPKDLTLMTDKELALAALYIFCGVIGAAVVYTAFGR